MICPKGWIWGGRNLKTARLPNKILTFATFVASTFWWSTFLSIFWDCLSPFFFTFPFVLIWMFSLLLLLLLFRIKTVLAYSHTYWWGWFNKKDCNIIFVKSRICSLARFIAWYDLLLNNFLWCIVMHHTYEQSWVPL